MSGKLRAVWVGKTRDAALAAAIADYSARIRRFLPFDITEVKDPKAGDDRRQLEAEAEKILVALDAGDRVIALEAGGTLWSSAELAVFVGKHLREDPRRLTFLIGGYGGMADAVRKRAERRWSLSPLTFTHEMTRMLVVEQLYRALCILNNHPYSK